MSSSDIASHWLRCRCNTDGPTTLFSIADRSVTVTCSSERVLAVIERMLRPSFSTNDATSVAHILVCDTPVPDWLVRAFDDGRQIMIRRFGHAEGGEDAEWGRRLPLDERSHAIMIDRRVVYAALRDDAFILVVGDAPEQVAQLAIKDILRTAISPNTVHLHAATVSSRGKALLYAGPKGAGKTTLALTSCISGGASYVTNDRTIIGERKGKLVAMGWPSRIRVAPGTLAQPELTCSRLAQGLTSKASWKRGKFELMPSELPHLGITVQGDPVPVGACIFPSIVAVRSSGRGGGYALERLSPEDVSRRLGEQALSWPEDNWPHWSEWFTDDRNNPDRRQVITQLAEHVPGYSLTVMQGARWPVEVAVAVIG